MSLMSDTFLITQMSYTRHNHDLVIDYETRTIKFLMVKDILKQL